MNESPVFASFPVLNRRRNALTKSCGHTLKEIQDFYRRAKKSRASMFGVVVVRSAKTVSFAFFDCRDSGSMFYSRRLALVRVVI